ncbi:MAG: N-acetylmuramoyl-L-alanine amidase [Oscillospiraceae bacterium]|nr:N-acetylmuramoyl-L-alanine amidase [Oscillospiraceae bacterium]
MKISRLKIKWNVVFVALTFCAAAAVITYASSKLDNAVVVSTEPQAKKMVVIDAGHGGMDGGGSAADGTMEKGINLNIALSVRDMCVFFGYSTETTRDRDVSIHDREVKGVRNQKVSDMENRLALFNKYPGAVCISIHQNIFTDPQYRGAQMFFSENVPESERLASIMQSSFVRNLQPDNMREIKPSGSELFLCHNSINPAVMVECGFLTNPEEAELLKDRDYQRLAAFTIFSGIKEFIVSSPSV